MSFQVGDKVSGRYRVDALIGGGGQAYVYRATDERTGKTVALKSVTLGGDDDALRHRFTREVKALSMLDHPSIVRLVDVSEPESAEVWVVTEFLRGRDLQQIISARGRVPEVVAVHIAERVFSALAEAHAIGVAHRDIKPANIFLCENGRVVLLDFGVARGTSDGSSRTMAGSVNTSVVGTPYFMSPEQLRGVLVSLPADLYSMAITLQYALTGELPFSGSMAEVLVAVMDGRRKPVRDLATLESSLAEIIEHCAAVDPSKRPQSAALTHSSIQQAAKHFPDREAAFLKWVQDKPQRNEAIETRPLPPVSLERDDARRSIVVGLGVVVALVIVAAIAWVLVVMKDRSQAPEVVAPIEVETPPLPPPSTSPEPTFAPVK